ncbi:Thioredoxin-like superfamily [Babesia duncani]|uniref:Thioredoxin-like superfamily n=1 Tax=Babesia duncani TaxID=323732 RepID=A0AAD9PP26_9APIC|nr:Thioredoxin-like superfamily [Babesia duncani]
MASGYVYLTYFSSSLHLEERFSTLAFAGNVCNFSFTQRYWWNHLCRLRVQEASAAGFVALPCPISALVKHEHIGMPQIGGNFSLVDQHGNTKTLEDFKGKHLLIYFGISSIL